MTPLAALPRPLVVGQRPPKELIEITTTLFLVLTTKISTQQATSEDVRGSLWAPEPQAHLLSTKCHTPDNKTQTKVAHGIARPTTVDSAGPLSSISNTEGGTRQLHKEGKSTVHMAEAKQF